MVSMATSAPAPTGPSHSRPSRATTNAVSAGPVKTVAARSIPGFMKMYARAAGLAPLGRNVDQQDVGNLGLFLLSPLAAGITGETVYVDSGYHVMGMDLGDLDDS